MTVSCGDLLRPAVWPALGLAMLLWSLGAPAADESTGVSSDTEEQRLDIGAVAQQLLDSLGNNKLPFTIMKVPKAESPQGLVGPGQGVIVVNVPAKQMLAGKSKGEVAIGVQNFKAAWAFADLLRKSGIDAIVAMDYAGAGDPWAVTGETSDGAVVGGVEQSMHKLKDKASDCLLRATDWSQCFEQPANYPEWYKGSLADDDPDYKSVAEERPSFFELRGFPGKGLAHRYEFSYE